MSGIKNNSPLPIGEVGLSGTGEGKHQRHLPLPLAIAIALLSISHLPLTADDAQNNALPTVVANAAKPAELDFLKPLVNIELSFIKRVCDPTDEQMTEIVSAAKESLQKMGDIITPPRAAMNAVPGGPEVFWGPNQERMYQNPYFRVREEVTKLLKPLVTDQQYVRYTEEAQARDLYERDAAVESLVEMLDKRLVLSPDQQSQVHTILMKEASLPDLQTLRTYSSNPQYLPSLTKGLIEPVLEPSQKQVWDSLNHVRVVFGQHLQTQNQSGFTEEWLK